MGRAILCQGAYAETPYYLEKACLSISSIEELCYYLCENACLLDKEIMDPRLVKWIGEECRFPELQKELELYLRKKSTVGVFVTSILKSVHYCIPQELHEIEQLIRDGDSLSLLEKRKASADYYAGKGKLDRALAEYEMLIREAGPGDDYFLGKVLHNMGTLYASLFEFEKAAGYYRKAYDMSYEPQSYVSYLAAKRMELPEEEYIRFITEEPKNYQMSVEVEKQMERAMEEFRQYRPLMELQEIRAYKNTGESAKYYTGTEQLIAEWKEAYRGSIGE